MRLRLTVVVLVCLAWSAPADAQFYAGPSYRPFGYYPYGAFGYFPSAFGSQWTNGYTLYGPPVPTYGAVPGAFGGNDQRLNVIRRDDPRTPRIGSTWSPNLVYPTFATIDLTLPYPDALVTVNETTLKQTGTTRTFRATQLPSGQASRLTLHLRWTDDDKPRELTRDIDVWPGQHVRVDFTR